MLPLQPTQAFRARVVSQNCWFAPHFETSPAMHGLQRPRAVSQSVPFTFPAQSAEDSHSMQTIGTAPNVCDPGQHVSD